MPCNTSGMRGFIVRCRGHEDLETGKTQTSGHVDRQRDGGRDGFRRQNCRKLAESYP